MPPQFKRILRTAQTWLPWIRESKFGAYNLLTRRFGKHVEKEFPLFAVFEGASLAIDVGGNWGQSIEALRFYAKPGLIVSFEPNPPLAERLVRIYGADPQVRIQPFGLSADDAVATLYTPVYGNYIYDGLTSFSRDEAIDFLTPERMAWFDPQKLTLREVQAPIKRLDDLNLSPDIAKLDVQGFELEVLRGGIETFRRSRPITIVENPSPEIVSYFDALEMPPVVMEGRMLIEGKTSGDNTLFMTADHKAKIIADGRWHFHARHA